MQTAGWSIDQHLEARRRGVSATAAITAVLDALDALDDPAILIGPPLRASALAAAASLDDIALDDIALDELPLHGVPFLVKDNIDVAGVPTTCACPAFGAVAAEDAAVVARLRAAGAVPVGKTNLDQFASGVVGTRSPYGTPRNPLDATLVPGGSSSGSAVAVARGLVPFALGTDTAGSGRVPAALCGVVGWKPTVGRFPSVGIVPAVRSADCPSIFARSVRDACRVARAADGHLPGDPFSRRPGEMTPAVRTLGVLAGDANARAIMQPEAAGAYDLAVAAVRAAGFATVDVDVDAFLAAGELLYGSAIVAQRTASVGEFIDSGPAGLDPTVSAVIGGGRSYSAVDAYECGYRLAELRAATVEIWRSVDALLLPTTPGVATVADVVADPVGANAWLGTFTTFANLVDLAAVAVPTGGRADGLPAGVQLLGPAWSDEALADAAALVMGEPRDDGGVRPGEIAVAVVGAHLSGMPLHWQLASRRARLVAETRTSPSYRLYALPGTVPPKPGLRRVTGAAGAEIVVEVWALAPSDFASFVAEIPPPLGVGSVELADGTWCKGFICEPGGFDGARDITEFGGWRAYAGAPHG